MFLTQQPLMEMVFKGNSDLEVVVSENPTEAARNGTLVITQSEGNKTVSVTLTQVAPSAV